MNAAISERKLATEEISGVIERVTFHNDESGFCVLRVKARNHWTRIGHPEVSDKKKILSSSQLWQVLNSRDRKQLQLEIDRRSIVIPWLIGRR
jgi:hypothetical protein